MDELTLNPGFIYSYYPFLAQYRRITQREAKDRPSFLFSVVIPLEYTLLGSVSIAQERSRVPVSLKCV